MELTWLSAFAKTWLEGVQQARVPHAVLLAGPPGVGKRAAATWMVAQKLGLSDAPCPVYPFERPVHADLRWLEQPEDKHSILIDQVRGLVADLSLTSYEGRGKAAVIEPANAMNNNAANSLLKTLEEPPGDALLVLIADRTGKLPATIFSRCRRINFHTPAEAEGLAWLDKFQPGTAWADALRIAGNAPLAALQAAERLDTTASMARDFKALALGQASPVDIAQNWAKLEPAFVLEWLSREVLRAAKASIAGAAALRGPSIGDSVLQRIDSRNLICYLDTINRLRGQQGGSYNVQLALEGLLIDWATGLRELSRRQIPAGAFGN